MAWVYFVDFTCAPKFPTPVEGSPNAAPEASDLECFTCEGVASDEECISRGTVVRCDREFPTMVRGEIGVN